MSKPSLAEQFGLSQQHWDSLSDLDRALYQRIRPLRASTYTVSHRIVKIEDTLQTLDRDARSLGGKLELCPDFQRGHVWTQDKQIAFIEAILRGTAPTTIRFNCPRWDSRKSPPSDADMNPNDIVCVDGLQRLTAMRDFVAGKFKIFDNLSMADLDDTSFSFRRLNRTWMLEMFDIGTRQELLQFYLDLNDGGVVHSPEELARVRGLLKTAKESRNDGAGKAIARKPRGRGASA